MQPKTAEISRAVFHLFNKNRISKRQDWVFPTIPNSPVVLEISGFVAGIVVPIFFHHYKLLYYELILCV